MEKEMTKAQKEAVKAVTSQLCNMLFNNVINENGTEPFSGWCNEQFDEYSQETKEEIEKLMEKVCPIIDNLCYNHLNVGL